MIYMERSREDPHFSRSSLGRDARSDTLLGNGDTPSLSWDG
jgi:hypothetical protein